MPALVMGANFFDGARVLGTVTIPDAATFVVAAIIVLGGALGVVFTRNPVHAALMLVMTLFGVAVLFVEENAQFLAAVQVIVYTGAIVVLFLFVIMLLGVDKADKVLADTFRGQRLIASVLGILVLAEIALLARGGHWTTGAHSVTRALNRPGSNISQLGESLFTRYLLPFEATSALLIVAIVGAVVLARRSGERDGDNQAGEPGEANQSTDPTQPGEANQSVDPADKGDAAEPGSLSDAESSAQQVEEGVAK